MGEIGGYAAVEAAEDSLIPNYVMGLINALRDKYPSSLSGFDIISETLEKAVTAETKRKNRQKKN